MNKRTQRAIEEVKALSFIQLGHYFEEHVYRYKNEEFYAAALNRRGAFLELIKDECITENLCNIAISQSAYAIKFVPDQFKLEVMVLKCIEQMRSSGVGQCIQCLSEKDMTEAVLYACINKSNYALQYIPDTLKTAALCKAAIELSGDAFRYVPDHLKTESMCFTAINNMQFVTSLTAPLQYVPNLLLTEAMIDASLKDDGVTLEHVEKNNITQARCKLAVESNPEALKFVPDELKDLDICAQSAKSFVLAPIHTPTVLQFEEAFLSAYMSNATKLIHLLAEEVFHVQPNSDLVDLTRINHLLSNTDELADDDCLYLAHREPQDHLISYMKAVKTPCHEQIDLLESIFEQIQRLTHQVTKAHSRFIEVKAKMVDCSKEQSKHQRTALSGLSI